MQPRKMHIHVVIIAEAGVNHDRHRFDLALKLVDAAADAGSDMVKFQTFKSEKLVTSERAQGWKYQVRNTRHGRRPA